MRYFRVLHFALCLGAAGVLVAQNPSSKDDLDVKLPNGKTQREEIKDELEKGDRNLVSVKTLKQLDDVEKLAKDIRQRLRRN